MDQGLAHQLSAQGPQGPQNPVGMSGPQKGPNIDEVITLLMQGATPEELLQMGIPEALIMEAISIIENQASGVPIPEGTPQGLATSSLSM